MNRKKNIEQLAETPEYDFLIIGGGASGLGIALDAANRGYKTLLLEKNDFAKGTSSRSTKLVHGGVRYLQNGDISLVIEALRERGIMRKNAPHLVRDLSFVIPSYDWWNSPFYGLGLKVYDMMAGNQGLGPSTVLNKEETINLIPNVKKDGLWGGVIYQDGQFDDARMAVSIALTADREGANLINYFSVNGLIKENKLITGVKCKDQLTGIDHEIKAKCIINATGVFTDEIIKKDDPQAKAMIRPSQGIHLVLDKKFLDGPHAILVPHTTDGRVLFAVPWNGYVLLGTTDTLIDETLEEPIPLNKEVDFILKNAGTYMTKKPTRDDVKSVFAGLRPLAASEDNKESTKEVSRHHKVIVSKSGLISVLGGKWTTYRKIAEDTTNVACSVAGLPERQCGTQNLNIVGYDPKADWNDPLHVYGSDSQKVKAFGTEEKNSSLSEKVYITENQICWSIENEMAITLEDVLARRTRCLFLDSAETEKIAPKVAEIMRSFLKEDYNWLERQLTQFNKIIKNYQLC